MRVFITGASGFVGRHLVASLQRDGKLVTLLSRGPVPTGDPDRLHGPVDLTDLDTYADLPETIDGIVHLAARNPSRKDPATPIELARANVAGTAAVARFARRQGVRRIIFLSTANVHAAGAMNIREGDSLQPQSPYAASKAGGEVAFWQALEGGRTQGCVLRPAPVYGRGGRGNVATLVRLANLPVPLPIGKIGGRRSLIAVDSLVSAITLCLCAEGAAGETFLVADEEPLKPGEIVQALRKGWGRRAGVYPLPKSLGLIAERGFGARGLMADFSLDSTRLSDRTGWHGTRTSERLADMAAAGEL